MREKIQKRADLLIENQGLLQKAFWLENGLLTAIAGATFAEKDQTVDVDRLKECQKILRKKQGVFSEFRGDSELIVSTKMALSGEPEAYIDEIVSIYEKLQKGKFWGSSYRALAASTIREVKGNADVDDVIERTKAIMDGMNKEHPFLTSDEDTCFAVLLAMTGRNVDDILAELEDTFQYIKKNFAFHENAAYSLSQVITTYEGNSQDKIDKVLGAFEAFKAAGAKYGKEYELASLGTLIGIDGNMDDIVSEIVEVSEYLKGNKGFGALTMSKVTRLMFGTMIVVGADSADGYRVGASVIGGTVARVIAEQTAMLVAIMAASTASMTSSSSN